MSTLETTRPLCIWITGEPVPAARERRGAFADMIRKTVGDAWDGPWAELDCVTSPDQLRGVAEQISGVIVTGSGARVADQLPWMVTVQDELRELVAREVPIFGICFGHQLLGMALGGRSGPNPRGREMGIVEFSMSPARSEPLEPPDPLFGGAGARFDVATTHLDSVLQLPRGAMTLGSTEGEPNAAVRFGPSAWGVQFHPEFDEEIIGDYIRARADALVAEGFDPGQLLASRRKTPESAALLRRFASHVRSSRR